MKGFFKYTWGKYLNRLQLQEEKGSNYVYKIEAFKRFCVSFNQQERIK